MKKMRKLSTVLGVVTLLALASCSSSDKKVDPKTEGTTEESSTTTTTTTTTKSKDETNIELDANGLEIGKKDGNSETNIKISTDSSKLKIKR